MLTTLNYQITKVYIQSANCQYSLLLVLALGIYRLLSLVIICYITLSATVTVSVGIMQFWCQQDESFCTTSHIISYFIIPKIQNATAIAQIIRARQIKFSIQKPRTAHSCFTIQHGIILRCHLVKAGRWTISITRDICHYIHTTQLQHRTLLPPQASLSWCGSKSHNILFQGSRCWWEATHTIPRPHDFNSDVNNLTNKYRRLSTF